MDIDHSLTIVLALKDRVPFTIRWMRYAEYIHLPFKVLIADGGADERVPKILSHLTNFSNVDYEYIRYPYDRTYTDYYAKLADALTRVETPFVAMADNDDFFVVDGLMRSIEFLRQHSECSSCRGVIGAIIVAPNPNFGELSQVYGTEISFAAHRYPSGSIDDASALQRIQDYCSCYRTTWYDVFRTEQAVKNWQVLKDLNTKDLLVAEYIPQLIGIASGKVHVDSYLYLTRQVDGPGSSSQNEQRQKGDPLDRMFLETWSDDVKGLVNAVAAVVADKDGIPLHNARQQVRKSYRNFMAGAVFISLLQQNPRYRIISQLRGPVGFVRSVISGQPLAEHYIAAHRFVTLHAEFKPIYEFLTTPPLTDSV